MDRLPEGCIAQLCLHLDPRSFSSLAACSQHLNAAVLQLLDALHLDADSIAPPSIALLAKLRHVRRIEIRSSTALTHWHLQHLLHLVRHLPSQPHAIHFPSSQLLLPGQGSLRLLQELISAAPALAALGMPHIGPSQAAPPEALRALPATLRALDLQGSALQGADLHALACLTSLEELHAGRAEDLAGRHLEALAGLTRLCALTLGPLQQLGGALRCLSRLRALRHLDLGADVMGGARFGARASLTALRSLVLNDCPGLREADLAALAALRQLSSMRVGITVSAATWHLLAGLPLLRHLDISALVLRLLPRQRLPPSASVASADLLVLDASEGVRLAQLLPSLRVLQLDVATAGSLGCLEAHPQLSKLYVARANGHTLAALWQLSSLRSLRSLSLMAASRAGISGIATVGAQGPACLPACLPAAPAAAPPPLSEPPPPPPITRDLRPPGRPTHHLSNQVL
jgi:hypothetical protein